MQILSAIALAAVLSLGWAAQARAGEHDGIPRRREPGSSRVFKQPPKDEKRIADAIVVTPLFAVCD